MKNSYTQLEQIYNQLIFNVMNCVRRVGVAYNNCYAQFNDDTQMTQ